MLFFLIFAYACAFASATNIGTVRTFMTDYLKHEEENDDVGPSETFAELRKADKLRFYCISHVSNVCYSKERHMFMLYQTMNALKQLLATHEEQNH